MDETRESKTSGPNLNFRLFWLGQGISTLGDAFGFVAIPLLVLDATGSIAQMGVVTGLTCAGQILAGLFSGVVVDRVHRRILMIACDIGRVLLYALLPAMYWLGQPNIVVIYVVALLAGLLGNLFTVAQLAAIPNLVDRGEIARANGKLQATHALTYVVGAMLAGAVSARFGPASALLVDALSFAASALCLAFVRFRQDTATRETGTHGGGALAEFMIGIRYLLDHPTLRALAIFQMFVALFASIGLSAAVIDLLVFRLQKDLGQSSQTVGVALGIAAAGAVFGALTSPRLRGRFGFASCALGGTGIQAVGLMLAGMTLNVIAVVAGAALWSAGLTIRAVACNSLRQTMTPDALLGRVSAAGWTLVYAAGMLGAFLVTWIAEWDGTAHALLITGGALAVISAAAVYSPLARSAATAPVPERTGA